MNLIGIIILRMERCIENCRICNSYASR